MKELISYEEKQEYGVILMNRPEKRNAISIEMANDLTLLLEEIKDRPIKFLVIKSAGDKVFCAGGDLNDFHGNLSEEAAYETLHTMKQVLFQLVTLPIPTICLLQGNALGGGCELATACDIRIAKQNSHFGFVQSNLGILPGWGGGALLYEKVHSSFALQWLTEGNMYSSSFLLQKGWLHEVIHEDEWGDEEKTLRPYTNKSLEQLRYLKSQYVEALSVPTLLEKMEKESVRCSSLWASEQHQNKVKEFQNR